LRSLGALAFLAAFFSSSRYRFSNLLGILLGLPFLVFLLYHWWMPFLLGYGFWYNGASYVPSLRVQSVEKAIKLFTKEWGSSVNILPRLHSSDLFVDLTHITLTILVVLALYFSVRALYAKKKSRETDRPKTE